jgi:hypothetical protein
MARALCLARDATMKSFLVLFFKKEHTMLLNLGKLLWIASYPKSGSTWVRAFLHNYFRKRDTPYDINALGDLSTGEAGASLYRKYDPRPASQYSIADVQRMRPLVHRDLTAIFPDLVFVKTHNAQLIVGGIPLITPEVTAGAIYIVRDPRDIAISFSHHLDRSLDETIAFMADPGAATGGDDRKVYERLSTWSVHVHYWTRYTNPRLHVMQYEAMVQNPAAAFASMLGFLGEDPPRERFERALNFSAFDRLRAQEQASGFVEQPVISRGAFFRSGRPGEWETTLTPAQQHRIESDHAVEMRRFGYL